jgi:hypothetical protein
MDPDRFCLLTAPSWSPGFFSCYQVVVGFLNWYEEQRAAGLASGMKVFFEKGLYFDATVGPNWWEYYFEPIQTSEPPARHVNDIGDTQKSAWATAAISTLSRERAGEIIRKYVRVKPHIQDKIDRFVEAHFRNEHVVGVHYRGTDKSSEAPRVAFEVVRKEIQNAVAGASQWVVFVATDEQGFLDYIRGVFGAKVVCINACRSTNHEPIHHIDGAWAKTNRYNLGEEAVIDCVLLSRTSVMIRTHSNLSSSAANINPTLPVIDLNHAHYCDGLR